MKQGMDLNGRYFILNDWQMLMQHDTIWSKSPLMFVMFIMYHDDVSILFILSHSVHSRVQNVPLTNCGLGKIGVLALLRDPLHLRPPREAKKSVAKRIRHNYFDRFDSDLLWSACVLQCRISVDQPMLASFACRFMFATFTCQFVLRTAEQTQWRQSLCK